MLVDDRVRAYLHAFGQARFFMDYRSVMYHVSVRAVPL